MSKELAIASFARLLESSDEESLGVQLQESVSGIGFESFKLHIDVKRPMLGKLQYVAMGYPLSWQEILQDQDSGPQPPLKEASIRIDTPRTQVGQSGAAIQARLWEDVGRHKVTSGISLPSQEKAGVTSELSLSRDIPLPIEADALQHLCRSASILSACVHLAVVKTLVPSLLARNEPQLSERERECVSWAAHGKTSEEIGKLLHISEPTVVFHINKVLRKLGARNRMHAVALCVALGLIN